MTTYAQYVHNNEKNCNSFVNVNTGKPVLLIYYMKKTSIVNLQYWNTSIVNNTGKTSIVNVEYWKTQYCLSTILEKPVL